MSKLLVVNDGKRERELLLVESLVVGRDPACDISHDDALLSRRHAEFLSARNEVSVRDLGSRNGIFVNGTRTAERSLRPGDVVQIGPLRVRYVADRAPVSLVAEDFDATKVIPGMSTPPASAPPASATPVPASPPARTVVEEVAPAHEDVTRAFGASSDLELVSPAQAAAPVSDATIVPRVGPHSRNIPATVDMARPELVPEPGPSVASALAAGRSGGVPLTAAPVAASAAGHAVAAAREAHPVARLDAAALAAFVFLQLAVLSSVVFVASAGPLIVWQGETLGTAPETGGLALVRWPGLPIVIAAIATYVVATLVNRRISEALTAARQDQPSGNAGQPAGSSTSLPRS